MKKLIATLLALSMLLALAACGEETRSTATDETPTITDTPTTVVSSVDDSADANATKAPTKASTKAPAKTTAKVPTKAPTQAPTKSSTVTEVPTQAPTNAPATQPASRPTTNQSTIGVSSTVASTTTTTTVPHKHRYTSRVTTAAGCTSTGIKTFTCSCGNSYTEVISALGHSWEPATCTEPKYCYKCGLTEGNSTGHYWESATCTRPKTCYYCGLTSGSTASHSYSNGKCTMCGKSDPNMPSISLPSMPYTPVGSKCKVTDMSVRFSGTTLYVTMTVVPLVAKRYCSLTIFLNCYSTGAQLTGSYSVKSYDESELNVPRTVTITITDVQPGYRYSMWLV